MEFKHFSHNHGLVLHKAPQGSEIHCSGCKYATTGTIYACWSCSYFLDDHCFSATPSLKHPSHTLHPLTLVPCPTYPSGSFFCNSCNLIGNGFSYCCSECDFDMHVHCALRPNANPHTGPNFSVPNDHGQNYNHQPQNQMYPPPMQNNHFPTYPAFP
ncbi:hypothetical protein ACJIZ3_016302 [Penstemon smallii]|uniref:DC1 domain-containing protein n=1 Tax=Penstemon smallii TaxID=265156 RepID=A0ABD3RQ06_9LAMI